MINMSKLRDIIFGTSAQISSIFNGGTVSGHSYSNKDLYLEEIVDEVELGATGSYTSINENNQLVVARPPQVRDIT